MDNYRCNNNFFNEGFLYKKGLKYINYRNPFLINDFEIQKNMREEKFYQFKKKKEFQFQIMLLLIEEKLLITMMKRRIFYIKMMKLKNKSTFNIIILLLE